jgi:hypothetical protein
MARQTRTPLRRFVHYYFICITVAEIKQTELEHRTPKSRYMRTSRKSFVKQLADIERRQTRIRRAREQFIRSSKSPPEVVVSNLEAPYNMGKSQNQPVNIEQFQQMHEGDPAVKVSSSAL